MPQLMPLYWVFYVLIFFVLALMFKGAYSLYCFDKMSLTCQSLKIVKNLWLW